MLCFEQFCCRTRHNIHNRQSSATDGASGPSTKFDVEQREIILFVASVVNHYAAT